MNDQTLAAMNAAGGLELDRIFLSDHVREIEIGAYPEEFGRTQRVRFNIELEVQRFAADAEDEVGSVVSYDNILDAISAVEAGPRIKLVETFAARLADLLLADDRIHAAHIRIEKLDRVAGSLGYQSTRRRR